MLNLRPYQIVAAYALTFLIWLGLVIWESSSATYQPAKWDTSTYGDSKDGTAESGDAFWKNPLAYTATEFLTLCLVIFSFFLALFTWQLVRAGSRQARHFAASERAYIVMSHQEFTVGEEITIPMRFQNCGRTPGTLTGAIVGHWLVEKRNPPPTRPTLPCTPNEQRSFLVPNDGVGGRGAVINLNSKELADIWSGDLILWYWGYVDYMDIFEGRHRYGYARIFDPQTGCLVLAGGNAFNYDRERRSGEGNDW